MILVFVIILFAFTIRSLNWLSALMIALIYGMAGCFSIPFGFLGVNFAFGVVAGHIDRSKERGKINGLENKVHVPFLRNYVPLEWWNVRWFMTVVGFILSILSVLVFGYTLGNISQDCLSEPANLNISRAYPSFQLERMRLPYWFIAFSFY